MSLVFVRAVNDFVLYAPELFPSSCGKWDKLGCCVQGTNYLIFCGDWLTWCLSGLSKRNWR